jgi:hypothetical protein
MKKSIVKYLAGIIFCEVLLVLNWIHLAADVDVSNYDSVKKVLSSSQASQPPEFQLASPVIHRSSKFLDIMSVFVLLTSSIVVILSFLIGFEVFKNLDKKP